MTARFLVTVSSEMQAVAVGWQIYALTGRPLDLGLVGLAQFLPGMLLFLVAGHTADRRSRRRILEVCYAAFAACSLSLLGLSLAGLSSVYPIYAVFSEGGRVESRARAKSFSRHSRISGNHLTGGGCRRVTRMMTSTTRRRASSKSGSTLLSQTAPSGECPWVYDCQRSW